MKEPMDMLASRVFEAVCFVGPSRTGKCLDLETRIPTPSGWTTMREISAGDYVIAPDGAPTKVLASHEVKRDLPCYRVEFSDGTHLIADSEHLWGVERFYWRKPNWRPEVLSTERIARDVLLSKRGDQKRFRYKVRNTKPIELPEVDLEIDPYLLGVWLGDGSSSQASVHARADDAAFYADEARRIGHSVSLTTERTATRLHFDRRERLTTHCQRGHEYALLGRSKNGGCDECRRLGHHKRKYGKTLPPKSKFAETFASELNRLDLIYNKHIPPAYLRASASQRLALLQGLMDTDGCWTHGRTGVEFTSARKGLAADFCELARTLGFKPIMSKKRTTWVYRGVRKSGEAYRVTFPIDGQINPFRLPRKADQIEGSRIEMVNYRQIVSVTPTNSRPVRCIQVEHGSHMFLAGEGMVATHNTMALVDGWMARNIVGDPGDMFILQMSQEKSREFSKVRVDREIRRSPLLRELLRQGDDDNTHDKLFKHGMWLKLGWPSPAQLSSSDYRYVAITDHDRMPDDIGGEGAVFQLALKRIQTYLSRGMCVVESSPGRPLEDANWVGNSPHAAPPVGGILGIYNGSDRRRWYWQCPDCRHYFEAEPGLSLFAMLPEDRELEELVKTENISKMAKQYAHVVCPHCAVPIGPQHKPELNSIDTARWVAEGQSVTTDGEVIGEAPVSKIAGYWLGGVAAAYQSWESLLQRYFLALRDYATSGSEKALQTTVNTDQGMPYLSQHLKADKGVTLQDRAEHLPRYHVPDEACFLIGTADVQGGLNSRFVCEVRAFGPDLESWLIDRFELRTTEREGDTSQVDPAGYAEDWDLLTDRLVNATYKTDSGREIRVYRVGVDTGGEDGVTANATAWFSRLRRQKLSDRVLLLKGASLAKEKPMVKGFARNQQGKRIASMPIWQVGTDYFKDVVAAALRRRTPGALFFHVPDWLHANYFEELRAEVRQASGKWKQVRPRNEALDLWVYALAVVEALGFGATGNLSWRSPPAWARSVGSGTNSEMLSAEERREMKREAAKPAQRRRTVGKDDWSSRL